MSTLKHTLALALLKRVKQHSKSSELVSLKTARKAGIVYNARKIKSKVLKKEKEFFTNKGIEVFTLGFVDAKDLQGYSATYKDAYFCRADLNFWGHVKSDSIKGFLNETFDYLLNLDVDGNLSMQSVSVLSSAKTRFGKQFDTYEFAHDFMVKSHSDTPIDLLKEITHYIK